MSIYISGTEAYKEYDSQIKKATELSEVNTALISEFLTCGGINLDVLEFFGTHDIKKEEYIKPILPLVRNNAELEWYELVNYVIENKRGEISVVRWLEIVVEFFVEGISCDIARNAVTEFNYIHKVANVKNQLLKEKAGDEARDVYNVIKDVQMVLSAVEREETTKEENVKKLEQKIIELGNEINIKNEKILELKSGGGEVQSIREELEYYKSSYEKQLRKNTELKGQFSEAQAEIFKFKKEKEKLSNEAHEPKVDNDSMKEVLDKINELSGVVKNLGNETETSSDVPEKLLTFISSSLNNQKNEIDNLLSEKLGALFSSENMSAVVKASGDTKEVKEEEKTKEEPVTEEEKPSTSVSADFDLDDEEEVEEEKTVEVKEEKIEHVPTEKKTSEGYVATFDNKKKQGLLSYFQEKKKNRMIDKFLSLKSEQEQTSAILAQTLKRKFHKDTVRDIKSALKSKKVTPEFIYSIVIDESLTLDELNKVLVE